MPPTSAAGARPRTVPSRIAVAVAVLAALSAGMRGWGFLTGFPQEGFAFL